MDAALESTRELALASTSSMDLGLNDNLVRLY